MSVKTRSQYPCSDSIVVPCCAVPRCFQCCIQFLSMLLLFLTSVQHVLCYLAHVDSLMMLVIYHGFTNYVFFHAKCFVRNDEIKL